MAVGCPFGFPSTATKKAAPAQKKPYAPYASPIGEKQIKASQDPAELVPLTASELKAKNLEELGKKIRAGSIGVLFGCLARKLDGPGLPGGLIIYQGHLFPLKGHLWQGHHTLPPPLGV